MNVLALVQSPGHVCARYRIEPFAWALGERGLLLEVAPLARGVAARLAQFRRARAADVVILQRKLLPLWQIGLLRRASRRLIYDVDDLLFRRDSYHPRGSESWPRLARFWATAYAADAITAGNEYLAGRVADYVGRDKVRLMPTCIEPRQYTRATHVRRGPSVRLVWIGQHSTLASLGRAAACFDAVGRRQPGIGLNVICDRRPELPGVRVELHPWSADTEAAELAAADIGLNWLPDDEWSRGKCGLRVLQYMAAGLPVVANPVGMNREMVVDGRTGFLASTPGEWAEAVARLAADPALRRQMGREGRRLVEERYSVDAWAPRFAQIVAEVAGGLATNPSRDREGTVVAEQDGATAPSRSRLGLVQAPASREPLEPAGQGGGVA